MPATLGHNYHSQVWFATGELASGCRTAVLSRYGLNPLYQASGNGGLPKHRVYHTLRGSWF
jgi:hypothetical protein